MRFLKFSLSFLIAFTVTATFDSSECLDASFETLISHKSFPFGWSQTRLGIRKDKCVLRIEHRKLKFIQKAWTIDVCREPVHIKRGAGSVDVLRREGRCPRDTDFCGQLETIEEVVQNDGLIFAAGEKEDLSSDHGKAYCSFLLIEKYLHDGVVLSRSSSDVDIFARHNDQGDGLSADGRCPEPAPEKNRTTIEANEQIRTAPAPREPETNHGPPSPPPQPPESNPQPQEHPALE